MNKIKKQLKRQANSVLPDDNAVKANIARELGFAEREEVLATNAGTTAARRRVPLYIGIAAILLAIALILIFILPPILRGKDPFAPGGNKFLSIRTEDDFYAYGAASVATLINSETNAQTASVRSQTNAQTASADAGAAVRAQQGHLTAEQALAFADKVGAQQTFFTHMGHDIGLHEETNRILPGNVKLAYDGQVVMV